MGPQQIASNVLGLVQRERRRPLRLCPYLIKLMGAVGGSSLDLNEVHLVEELENGMKLGGTDHGWEKETETRVIVKAVKVLLQGLGEDVDREGLKKTPLRVAKALREGTRGYKQKVNDVVHGALFPEVGLDNGVGLAGGVGGLVIVRDIDLFSYCEACLLPFQVKCHVGYVPSGKRVVGLSKLSRVADVFAKRLQEPERLADEICSALHHGIKPTGVAVILQCSHIHFPSLESAFLESDFQEWIKVVVSSGSGVFQNENSDAWTDFFGLLKFRGMNVQDIRVKDSSRGSWCPSRSSFGAKLSLEMGQPSTEMVRAVSSIIGCLGDDPSRKELAETPKHFLRWLMTFHNSNLEMKLNGYANGRTDPCKLNGVVYSTNVSLQSELNLPFWSQCEHHLLPFHGVVHIGYFSPKGFRPIGKQILQSIVHFYGFKLQVQERLTRQIAETVSSILGPDVMVVVEANHTCMISRGIEKFGSNTATIAVLGRFATDSAARAMFLQSIPST